MKRARQILTPKGMTNGEHHVSPIKKTFRHMKYRILSLIIFISLNLFSQEEKAADTLIIKMTPAISTRVVLYSAKGAQQKYISYADSDNGVFKLAVSKDNRKGMYRLIFDQKTMNYIDFIYLNKSFELQFNPSIPDQNPTFVGSPENQSYFNKGSSIVKIQQKIDSLQVVYFQETNDLKLKEIEKQYITTYNSLESILKKSINSTDSSLINDFVYANTRKQPKTPIKNPNDYLPFIKKHYFDTVDFNNDNLIHSSILIDKVMDYIFYLTVSKDAKTQNNLYKESLNDVLQRIDNQGVKLGFIKALIQSFAKDENTDLVDYLFTNYYEKLNSNLQDIDYKNEIQKELATAVGRVAPEITWKEGDKTRKLSELKEYKNYIIVFWSSTCSHCLKEIPKLYEFVKDNKDIKVIAFGMETKESQGKWRSETFYYPEFTHVLGLDKWENPIPRSYNVYASPNYFVLDADKIIIDKPYEVVDIKVFFKGLK